MEEFKRKETKPISEILDQINNGEKKRAVKIVSADKALKSKTVDLKYKLEIMRTLVYNKLGKYAENTLVIRDKQTLIDYITKSIENGVFAYDTETNNSLLAWECKIMGACIYTPGLKPAYVPINHVDFYTRELLPNQLTEADLKEQFSRLTNTKIIMHNAKFDIQVTKHTCGIELKCYWDTMIAASLLNENEQAGLKYQYRTYIDPTQEKYDIESLFSDIEYAIIEPELFALYSATDALITEKLYEYQLKKFSEPSMARLYRLFMEVEMPLVPVTADMEMTGVCIDQEYAERLKLKYKKIIDDANKRIEEEFESYKHRISVWRCTDEAQYHPPTMDKNTGQQKLDEKGRPVFGKSKSEKLADPPLITSPEQMAIFFYDVLKLKSPDKKAPRGTGEEILKSFKLPICDAILDMRSYKVLYNTFIDKLPKAVSEVDGRLHCHFKAQGTATGRFSSSDPNLQNIPSGEHSVRSIFTASRKPEVIKYNNGFRIHRLHEVQCFDGEIGDYTYCKVGNLHIGDNLLLPCGDCTIESLATDGEDYVLIRTNDVNEGDILEAIVPYVFVGSDYSAQEPRVMAQFSQDEYFLGALKEGKDPYATIATKVYKNNYEDNLEHHADGTLYPEGSKRRKSIKALLLGILYGMQTPAIAERLKVSTAEAEGILNDFFTSFPGIKAWMDSALESVHKNGYVEDLWGRRRRLPDANLPDYTIEPRRKDRVTGYAFNPLLNSASYIGPDDDKWIKQYREEISNLDDSWESRPIYDQIREEAATHDIVILNNMAFKSRAERQVVNAAIQGSAATLTKKAMLRIYNDPEMQRMGLKLLIAVHDELICEVPIEYGEEAAKQLSYDMCEAGKPVCAVQMKCDAFVFPGVSGKSSWYTDVYFVDIQDEYKVYMEEDETTAWQKLVDNHPEFLEKELDEIIHMENL